MKNYLGYSLEYKRRHKDSKIMIRLPQILNLWLVFSYPIITLQYIRYCKKEIGTYFAMLLPYFYISHNGYYLEFYQHNRKIKAVKNKIKIKYSRIHL